MKLPVLLHPVFDVTIPSTKHKIKIRPLLVKEEKILLMAKQSGTNADIYQAIHQIVTNCIVDADVKPDKFTLFDLEYVFLKLRAVSISNVVKVIYKDVEDKKDYPFDVDLDKLKVKFPEKTDHKIALGPDKGFVMQYPKAGLYGSEIFSKEGVTEEEVIEALVTACVESYFDGENVYKFSDNKKEDIKSFIENLDIETYNKIKEYVADLPHLHYQIKYTNSLGNERTIEMNTLSDFFTL